jgi:hypothetical protein
MTKASTDADAPRWLLLIHQIPPKPAYFRAKVGRRLARIGAVDIKNSVYALPRNEQTQEDLQRIAREIGEEGGEATLCKASLVEGLRDEQVEALFHTAREADYAQIAEEARRAVAETPSKLARDDERRPELEADLARLKKRLAEVIAVDFFGAPGREVAESGLLSLERRLRSGERRASSGLPPRPDPDAYRGRRWVTRKNVHVDRIASAWLIRRFIDEKASFGFVAGQGYSQQEGEVTFDMYDATFPHVGDRCTFEVLVDRFALREPGLSTLAEIVHDIDVKDGKFARPEATGIASLVAGIALAHRDDEARIALGSSVFDALLELYRRKRSRSIPEDA